MVFIRLILFLFIMLVCLQAPTTYAADINEEGATKLKALFSEMIEYQKSISALDDTTETLFEGDITVEPAGTYYAVTLPHIKVVYPDERQLEIGMVSINAAPHSEPDQWKMTIAMPTPILLIDKDRNQVARIDIGAQQAAGIWDEQTEYFVKMDANYQDITLQSNELGYSLHIPQLQTRSDFEKDDKGHLSGPAIVTINNFEADFGQAKAKIGEIAGRFDLYQYNTSAFKQYKEQIIALSENAETGEDNISPQHTLGLYNMISELLMNSGDGFKSLYSLSDLHVIRLSELDDTEETITIDKAHMGLDMKGFLSDTISMAFSIGYKNFVIDPTPPDTKGLEPTDLNINISIESLPLKEVISLGKNTLQSSAENPEIMKIAGLSLMMKIPALLSQSGTHIALKDNHISNGDYNMELDGNIRADITALNSATADAKVTIRGLEKTLEKLKKMDEIENQDQAQNLQTLTTSLEAIKTHAKIETTEDGETLHILEFTMDQQGKILLNGQDAAALMQPPAEEDKELP